MATARSKTCANIGRPCKPARILQGNLALVVRAWTMHTTLLMDRLIVIACRKVFGRRRGHLAAAMLSQPVLDDLQHVGLRTAPALFSQLHNPSMNGNRRVEGHLPDIGPARTFAHGFTASITAHSPSWARS